MGETAKDEYSMEGFPKEDGLRSERASTVSKLAIALNKHRFILVCGPPFSGKTSLAYLLRKHLEKHNAIKVMSITMKEEDKANEWKDVWRQKYNEGWADTVKASRQISTYIIIESGQYTYDLQKHCALWNFIKTESDIPKYRVAIIIFATYGYEQQNFFSFVHIMTAFQSERLGSLPSLYLSPDEMNEIYDNFTRLAGWSLDPAIRGYISWITIGHTGLVRCLLLHIKENFSGSTEPGKIYLHLHSAELSNALSGARGLPGYYLTEKLEYAEVCDWIISGREMKPEMISVAMKLVRCGYIMQTADSRFCFPSPLSERVYLLMRHKSLEEDKLLRIEFVDFMKNVLTRMDCSRWQLYKNNKRIMWKEKFWSHARALLPPGYVLIPNSNACQKYASKGWQDASEGYPDFFFASHLSWMVEMLPEELDMKEYEARFDSGGKYSCFMENIKEWALIDFHVEKDKNQVIKTKYKNMHYFRYSEDFSKFTLITPSGEQEDVIIPIDEK